MRRLLLASLSLVVLTGAANADEIWLRDGRKITTSKPAVTKGRNMLLTTTDGLLLSVPVQEVDLEKTAAEKARAASTTLVPTPAPTKPLTPAEAARRSSSTRRASVTLTDDTVAHGFGEEGGEPKGGGEGKVDVANVSSVRTKDGYSISGSVINSGQGEVQAVAVTIEMIAKDGTPVSSAFAQLAKDTLAPGEKTVFTASAVLDREVAVFRYRPAWRPVAPPADAKSPGGAAAAAKSTPGAEPEPTAAPTPPPVPTLVPIPRGDVAPPAANPPIGNPASGVFLPPPDVPKTTAKPPST